MKKMIVVGAGLCGTLLAIRLAQKGYHVDVYERRPDMRSESLDAGRSINLALSDRGLQALHMVGLDDDVQKLLIPMHGRLIHPLNGEPWLSRYSGREHDHINSISRPGLNILLLNQADLFGNLRVHFNHKCLGADLENGLVFLENDQGEKITVEGHMVFGTDGAGSAIRRSMMAESTKLRFNFSQHFLSHGYKELTIPAGPNNTWRIEKNALHIWPRQEYMLIALPNLDGSFTVTLFLAFEGNPGFDQLQTPEAVTAFFKDKFPSAFEHMPHVGTEFFEHPTPTLGTIRCSPWSAYDRSMVLGDAAHAIVPFYGQGMNCALEDVFELDKEMSQYGDDWSSICKSYVRRKPHADAIAQLALDNYHEMRDHVDNPDFVKKRQLEMQLEQKFEDYHSKYSLVTFNEHMSYDHAKKLGEKQDQFLLEFVSNIDDISTIDIDQLYHRLKKLS